MNDGKAMAVFGLGATAALTGLLFGLRSIQGVPVTLTWDKSREPDIAFYTAHSGSNSGQYSSHTNTTATNLTLEATGTTFFAVSATSANNLTSSNSNEVLVIFTNAPVVTNLVGRLRIISYVQSQLPEDSWRMATQFVSQAAIRSGVNYRSEVYNEIYKPDQLRLSVFIQEQVPASGSWINFTNYTYTTLMDSNTNYRALSFTELIP